MAENPEQPPPLERGYDFVLVVKEQGVDFECSICRSILRDAHSTPCHHAFCRNCLATWTKELEQGNRPITCPNCNLIFDPKKVQYNGFVDRMVKTSLEIKCKQEDKGCHWQGEIIDYQAHQGTCDYELVECQNKGCREVLSRKELVQHQKDCKYRTTECLYCRLIKPIIEMKDHHSECQMMKIICPNEQCETQVLRKDIKEHLNKDCLYEKISCCYSEIGCQKKVERCLMAIHQKDFLVEHQMMIFQDNKKVQQSLLEKNKQLEDDLKAEKKKNEKLKGEMEVIKKKVENLEQEQQRCNELHRNIFSIIDTLIYWVSKGFKSKEKVIKVLGKIQLSHLIKGQYNLLGRIVPSTPFKFMSFFSTTFVNEKYKCFELKGKEKSFSRIIFKHVLRDMKFNQMYQTGSFVMVKISSFVIGEYKVKYVDKEEFTELSRQANDFRNNNVVIVSFQANRTIFLYHPDISSMNVKICVIRNSRLTSETFALNDESCAGDFADCCLEHIDGNEFQFNCHNAEKQFILLVLYT